MAASRFRRCQRPCARAGTGDAEAAALVDAAPPSRSTGLQLQRRPRTRKWGKSIISNYMTLSRETPGLAGRGVSSLPGTDPGALARRQARADGAYRPRHWVGALKLVPGFRALSGSCRRSQCHLCFFAPLQFQCQSPCQPVTERPLSLGTEAKKCRLGRLFLIREAQAVAQCPGSLKLRISHRLLSLALFAVIRVVLRLFADKPLTKS